MKTQYTPREIAYEVAIDALRKAHAETNGEGVLIARYSLSPASCRNTRKWIATLHNKLIAEVDLGKSRLEGE